MSLGLVGGIASAAVAASCFDGGLALQALDARVQPFDHALKPRLLVRLARRRRWLAGTVLAIAGWPFHLVALAIAPLTVVQPTLALGLILLLYLGHRVLGEAVGRAEIAAVVALVAAVAVLAWAAPPDTRHHAGAAALLSGLVPLAALALLPLVADRLVSTPARLLPFAAGAAYAFTGLSSKLLVDELRSGHLAGVVLWTAMTGVLGFAGLLLEMSGLQKRRAVEVGPVVFVVQVSVPVLLAPVIGGESWGATPLGGGVIVAALAAIVASAITLTRSRAVAAFADEAGLG
ncbi:MAG TPA: hypothetical protein VE570_04180 [Thermoleophilaceae bacterium]|jgi:drug/metabolite transporter (DMT)-like permease|nr:hypothetical protein [Thermoleophilaceae bacterium]